MCMYIHNEPRKLDRQLPSHTIVVKGHTRRFKLSLVIFGAMATYYGSLQAYYAFPHKATGFSVIWYSELVKRRAD